MKEKIYSISESFSMQPASFYVNGTISNVVDGVIVKNIIDRIEFEIIQFPTEGENCKLQYCVGYNKEGNKLFQYRADSVNIHFQ
jgi:hypothetical protein